MARHIFLRVPEDLAELIASVCEQSAFLTKEEALRRGETDLSLNEAVQASANFAKGVRERVDEAKLSLETMALEYVYRVLEVNSQSFKMIMDDEAQSSVPIRINRNCQDVIVALVSGNHPQLKSLFETGQQYIEKLIAHNENPC